jgi:hypothetical protein
MQTLSTRLLTAAHAAASSGTPRRQRQQRRSTLAVRASTDVGFCRDKISERKDMLGEIEGTSTVVFLGVDGAEVPVEVPKVSAEDGCPPHLLWFIVLTAVSAANLVCPAVFIEICALEAAAVAQCAVQ